jgi:hypothetical protein
MTMILGLVSLTIMGISPANADDCPDPTMITVGNITVDPCDARRLNLPIYMLNPCDVGGFSFRVICSDPDWLRFSVGSDTVNWDTVGCRINDWESVGCIVEQISPGTIQITGIADMPGGRENVHLPEGNGLIITLHPIFDNPDICDSSQYIFPSNADVSDTSGFFLFDIDLVGDSVYVLPGDCHDNPRGDANCSGLLNGVDVTYLVAYLKGVGAPYCCLCQGDVNNSDSVNGVDVTFLVAYLKGQGQAPVPCD